MLASRLLYSSVTSIVVNVLLAPVVWLNDRVGRLLLLQNKCTDQRHQQADGKYFKIADQDSELRVLNDPTRIDLHARIKHASDDQNTLRQERKVKALESIEILISVETVAPGFNLRFVLNLAWVIGIALMTISWATILPETNSLR